MEKWLTDVHNHSTFSCDGISPLEEMLKTAHEKGVAFYGVAEHFDLDYDLSLGLKEWTLINEEEYFHSARHLQEKYEGAMNVLIGGEFGFIDEPSKQEEYLKIYNKYRPDFVVNSVHCKDGLDFYSKHNFYAKNADGELVLRDQKEVYDEYFEIVEKSLDAIYPYDIVGHLGYVSRYWPIEAVRSVRYADHAQRLDRILNKIIAKGKILELNASCFGLEQTAVTTEEILQRYFELGGRKVSYASDAHKSADILRGREKVVEMLKRVGFTYITVPCRGEHIKVEI